MNALQDWIDSLQRLPVAPLLGYPGARLTRTTIRENLFDAETHSQSILAASSRWHPDLVVPMMDLSVEAGALGLAVRFEDNESPTVEEHPVHRRDDLARLRAQDVLQDTRLQSFLQTISILAGEVTSSLGAYVAGPFTLAGLLMGANEVAIGTLRDPKLVHELLEFAAQVIQAYASACVRAGADLIVILEPTAVLLSPKAFSEFSGRHVRAIADETASACVLHICGNTTPLLGPMCETGVDGLSLDSAVDFSVAVEKVPESVVLVGNIDPVRVMSAEDGACVERAVRDLRMTMEGHSNFILSTGCDLPLQTPLDNIEAFMKAARAERTTEDQASDCQPGDQI